MIHYMDNGPFETTRLRDLARVLVLAYSTESQHFVYVLKESELFHAGSASADRFDPPPPIPAAVRKPQVGEVWVNRDRVALFLFSPDNSNAGAWYVMRADATHSWCAGHELCRPATPEEAEPFRPILDGLERSLGEN